MWSVLHLRITVHVERAAHGEAALVEDVGVEHRGFDVGVAKQFLDGADVIAVLQQVGGKAVAKGMWADGFGDGGEFGRFVNRFLHTVFVQMVAALRPAAPAGESELEPLRLNAEEMMQVIAFLRALDGPIAAELQWLQAPE